MTTEIAQDVQQAAEPVAVDEQTATKPQTPVVEGTSPEAAPAVEEDASQTGEPAPPATARDVSMSQSTVDLLKFVRFTDFVPCDYNKDGILDILALNSRLSTGYGFCGVGNGLFIEGPSFDLPFRPAAAASLGDSGNAINGLFLVSSSGTVSLFYPLLDDDPSMASNAAHFSVFRVDTGSGPVFAVHGEDEASVRVYSFVGGGLQDRGGHNAGCTDQVTDWYSQITTWDPANTQTDFPLPPSGMEKTARIADLNGDNIPDLTYYDSAKIVYLLSRDGKALAEEQAVTCHAKPVALRITDVDGNGFPDVLALIGASGTVEVYLTEPE